MITVGPDSLDDLALELWGANATHHQAAVPVPQLHWDDLDTFKAGEALEATLFHSDLDGICDGVAHAFLTIPPELQNEAFAIVRALRGRVRREPV